MSEPERQIVSLLGEAVEYSSPEERAAFLDEACTGDVAKRARVEELLRAYQAAGNFLQGNRLSSEPAATVDDPSRERPGTIIGPYKLMEQIGEGGMGLVFVAEQQQPVRRKVALKLIKPGMDTRQVVARFEAERQALALMDHPNIAKVLDGGETAGGRPYFIMELVKGVPITEFCDQNQVPIRERLELFMSVCQAVQHAHQKGIIHRDLKPSNVLVTSHDGTPVVKVIDFGVAKAIGQQLTDKTIYTLFSQMVGTPLYMSPEQAGQSGLDVDTRSDIYSLGVLLYELLTGTTPFDRKRLHEVGYDEMQRIIREEEPPRPSTRISTLGQAATTVSTQRQSDPRQLSRLFRGELDWIVMKALEKDRDRRYETANGLSRDVQRYLNDEPVLACPPSVWYRFRKSARRNKTTLAVGGLILLCIAVVGGGSGWFIRDRMARETALDSEVDHILNEAGPLMKKGKWPEALAMVERADRLLASAGRPERPPLLVDLHRDLKMVQRLEDIYLAPNANKDAGEEFFRGRQQDKQFAQAFQEFGIDVAALPPAETATQIGRTSVGPALIQTLDKWAALSKRARGDKDPFWKKLLAIAQQADADDWRNRFREALLQKDRPALEKLAAISHNRSRSAFGDAEKTA